MSVYYTYMIPLLISPDSQRICIRILCESANQQPMMLQLKSEYKWNIKTQQIQAKEHF